MNKLNQILKYLFMFLLVLLGTKYLVNLNNHDMWLLIMYFMICYVILDLYYPLS